MEDASPSNCTYCYALECALRIETTSNIARKGTITAKTAMVTVGRNASRQILLQVELLSGRVGGQPAVASYSLADCVLHHKAVSSGKASIEIPSRNMAIQLSNCAPRKLNVFLKSLQAKIDIMKADRVIQTNGTMRTPISVARSALLHGLPNVFNVLSPLSIGEIRKVRRLRGVSTGESPLAKPKTDRTPRRGGDDPNCRRTLMPIQEETTPRTAPKRHSTGELIKNTLTSSSTGSHDRVELSEEQKAVVRAVVSGRRNVFFTGSAGTGKSLVLRRIIEMLPATSTYITAATGVAACQLGGITLHSFAGIGVGGIPKEQALRVAESKKHIVKQWKTCTHLIIDEISMVDADFFTALEYVARSIRNNDSVFGGIQLIITGDFLQLPPVVKGDKEVKFCFESSAWSRSIHKTIMLNQVRRQDDQRFVSILQQIRVGKCDFASADVLAKTSKNDFTERGVLPTRLCTHTADAERVNKNSLEALKGEERKYEGEDSQYIPDILQTTIPRTLILKVGAQVMLNKNLDLALGLSNGSRGVIVNFSKMGFPVVKFVATGKEVEIRPLRTTIRIPGFEEPAFRRQLPLQLAWAISIHKSQGLTLDAIEMTLTRVFAEGQTYVALSRARSLDSIRVVGFDPLVVQANEKVVRYYESIKENEVEEDIDVFVIRKRSRLSF